MTDNTAGVPSAGDALFEAGKQASAHGKTADAITAYQRALAAYLAAGDQRNIHFALTALADTAERQKRMEQADQYYQEALSHDRAIGDRQLEALTLGLLSNLRFNEARYDDAERYLEEALTIGREIGNEQIVQVAEQNLNAIRRSRRMWFWRLFRLG